MAERLVLDPVEISGRSEFDLTPWIEVDGIDWGSAELEAYRASGEYGETVIDARYPNRQIVVPLVLKDVGGTAFATVRSLIQAKAALFQREGGYLRRNTAAGGTVYADIQLSGLTLSGGWGQAHKGFDVDAELRIEASPDFYEPERTLSDHTETTATEMVFTESDIDGDLPARVRVVVDEDQGQSQLGLIWGFRSRHYSAAVTAATRFEAEALNPLDTAAKVALSGASGGTVVTHGTLATNWTPVLDMRGGGTAYPTHTGTNRLWVRYRTTSGTAVQLRAVWDVGDMVFPVENAPVRSNAGTQFFIADLGELRLDPPPTGTHRWNSILQSKGDVGGENVSIDKVWVVNADEGYGVLRAPVNADVGLATYVDRDEFNQSAGDLNGKTSSSGKIWTTSGGATDLAVETVGKTIQRATTGDANSRWAISGAAASAAQVVQVDLKASVLVIGDTTASSQGALARWTDSSNRVSAHLFDSPRRLAVTKTVAGASTVLAQANDLPVAASAWWTIRLLVDASGRWFCWLFSRGANPGAPILVGQDSALATGGALASGKVGVRDFWGSATASTRNYDNFAAWAPTLDAVLHPNQSCELRTDGMYREDSTGTAYGPVSHVIGDLPRLPPTVEGRATEVFVKASRGDFGQLPDTAMDDVSVRVSYKPCWLQVPGT